MPFAAGLSLHPDTGTALDEACTTALAQLRQAAGTASSNPELALLFFSPHHANSIASRAAALQIGLGAACLVGCAGSGIVGDAQEIEQGPALSLWLARWTKPMTVSPFHLTMLQAPEGVRILGMPPALGQVDANHSIILLLADPLSFRPDLFLHPINESFRGLRVMGGMAARGTGSARSTLLLGSEMLNHGAVGVLLSGQSPIRGVVSHPCRPVGQPMTITGARQNRIVELDSQPPVVQLQQLLQGLSPQDRQLFDTSLHIGRLVNGAEPSTSFLVRSILALDRTSGVLTIDDSFRVGDRVQFLVRDPECGAPNLRQLLQDEVSSPDFKPTGALLFTCNRRGVRLFKQPDHDANILHVAAGDVAAAGFFADGEIGPVGGRNYLHNYVASIALFAD